jgi:excisionase family DNA binding protein
MAKEEMKPRSAVLREALEKSKQGDRTGKVMFSVAEVCAQLGVSRWMLYRLIREEKIKSVKIGSRRLVPVGAIAAFIQGLEVESGK